MNDRGSISVLVLGLVAVVAVSLAVLVDATSAFVQRRSLVAVADAAALAGAQSIDLAAYYRDGASSITGLDEPGVLPRVRAHLARVRTVAGAGLEGLTLDGASTDGRTVVVELSAPLTLPFTGRWLADRLHVESRAQLAYRASGSGAGPYP